MTVSINERNYRFDAVFISMRTHFNFFRRFFTYIFSFVSLFTEAIAVLLQKVPLFTPILNITSFLFDSLSFGSNKNHPLISNIIAIVGYSSLIVLGLLSLMTPTLFNPAIIPAFGLILGLYFEGITILNWYNNYKELSTESKLSRSSVNRRLNNAQIMFYAAIVTFISIFTKIFALAISSSLPGAAMAIFVVAQLAEITAVFGSLGKEFVNVDRNINYWFSKRKTHPAETTETDLVLPKNMLAKTDSTENILNKLMLTPSIKPVDVVPNLSLETKPCSDVVTLPNINSNILTTQPNFLHQKPDMKQQQFSKTASEALIQNTQQLSIC